ncbi:PREDICTED: LOW QUALITY PROTEIN: gamma-aminobutyric acid type B receptor subunit 2-like [Priapulus caudatus]|uniref:LOW QUALITY PROTEIN: gamma-aminobutyric acid type B receptor subunit 2-like n=1 Tax=Priapulus caudatus TaxID=37621 RepID=A0ABM1E648_PRICU|nr:PREDICTED: LOW QUALITY PROTEIN: gamma-aminobutyric acid type B receptor subunit 2-like [Priapulus caudatus]
MRRCSKLSLIDGKQEMCDGGLGTKVLFEQLHTPPTKIMVIGAGCSSVTQPTAQTSQYWNLIQLSYSSASPALSNREKYQKFFRVFPPESTMNPAKFDLLKYFGWKKVATIHETQDLFSLATTEFVKAAKDHGIEILTAESFAADPYQQVTNIKWQQCNFNRSLQNFQYTDDRMASIFFMVMNKTKFEGVSGPVAFNENGDRLGLLQVEQNQDDKENMVAIYYNDRSVTDVNVTRLEWLETAAIFWQGGGPPVDSVREVILPVVVRLSLFLVMAAFAGVGIVLAFAFLIFNIKYRNQRYIKMSSPNLNNLILLGALLSYVSIIFSGLDSGLASQKAYSVLCQLNTWCLSLGFSLAFGAMFSKTCAFTRLQTRRCSAWVIKDYQLMALVAVLVMLDVAILMAWQFVDKPVITVVNQTTYPNPLNEDELIIPQMIVCESKEKHWYFAGALYAYKGLLLIFGAFLAWETRKVSVPVLNDSKYIGLSVYNVVVLCLIGVPIAFVMKSEIDLTYCMLISAFILFATTLTICLVFIPKRETKLAYDP